MIGSSTSPPFGVVPGGALREQQDSREGAVATGTAISTARPSPFTFEAAGSTCFGWLHAARAPSRGVGVVLCRPIGYEAMCTHQTYASLALELANAGFAVLRFDYPGTGDSSGNDAQPDRVKAWQEGIIRAVAEVRQMGDVTAVALVGVRLGATLAAQAACELGGIDSLVMWAPCTTGRAFARELRAANASREIMPDEAVAPGDMEALGYLYTAQTLADFERLDASDLPIAPARRALVIGRDDMPAEGPLPAKYRELGVATEYCGWPGYAAMMNEPHKAQLDPHIVGRITQWLSGVHPVRANRNPGEVALPTTIEYYDSDVRDTPLRFGPSQSLFGILAEPSRSIANDKLADVAVVMINVGANTHIGPNRLYTHVARALAGHGYRMFRMDLTGMGDSRPDLGFSNDRLFSDASTADVRAALELLSARGFRRFYLLGICSGSFVAFQTALADPRVIGQILMNARLLERRKGERATTWDNAMQEHYKSTHHYVRSLSNLDMYRRLLRGEVNVTGITRRVATVLGARMHRGFSRLLGRVPDEGVLAKTKHLSARGTDTLVIMAAPDDGRDYIEFHYGRNANRMRGDSNFRMVIAEGCDHTFSTLFSQRFVIDTLREHLDARLSNGAPATLS